MSSLELYWVAGTCARVPFVALEEIGAPFALRALNRYRGETESASFAAVNPKQKVPVLVIDGLVVTENPVILTTLSRAYPEAKLLPSDEVLAVEAQSTMAWFASGIHPDVARQRFPQVGSRDSGCWEGVRLLARENLGKVFKLLEARLAERDWLFGGWSIVDAYMYWLWFRAVGSGMDAAAFPRCRDHAMRIEQRPSVAAVLDREEAEFGRYEAEGIVPASVPPYQVGRLPQELVRGSR